MILTTDQRQAIDRLTTWLDDAQAGPLAVLTGPDGSGRSTVLADLERDGKVLISAHRGTRPTDVHILRHAISLFGGYSAARTGLALREELVRSRALRPEVRALAIDDAELSGARLELVRSIVQDNAAGGLKVIVTGEPALRDRVERRRSLAALVGCEASLDRAADEEIAGIISRALAPRVMEAEALRSAMAWSDGLPSRATALVAAMPGGEGRITAVDIAQAVMLQAAQRSGPEPGVVAQLPMPLDVAMRSRDASLTTTQRGLWEGADGD